MLEALLFLIGIVSGLIVAGVLFVLWLSRGDWWS